MHITVSEKSPAFFHPTHSTCREHESNLSEHHSANSTSGKDKLSPQISQDHQQTTENVNVYSERDLYRMLVRVRSRYHNWTYVDERSWGPETRWSGRPSTKIWNRLRQWALGGASSYSEPLTYTVLKAERCSRSSAAGVDGDTDRVMKTHYICVADMYSML